ncbi:MAG: methyltransferase domain-containing protein [Bryobacterales bacterium]|nr:methyltransferase domain-containing protein [Bryobacterales bacterium]
MKVAFFSPLPPAESGIADYSAALIEPLRSHCEVETFSRAEQPFDPAAFDMPLYQIGNNPDHIHAYETALAHPGVVVLHEANLHHLIASLTIKRGDWDAYLRECEYNGGAAALEFAREVRALKVGPDYDGVPMLRRLLESARGLIAHSDFVLELARKAGYSGPCAKIPHGAWIPQVDTMGYRTRLGLDPASPLIGVFGHLKPYKRIAESLRAFRRVVKHQPEVRMILVGEPHPDLPLDTLIASLGLQTTVRVLGRAGIADFVGYLGACDIVLNLRYPTVGETSGTLLRALGLGKAVLVSNVGAFAEFPDDVCVKIPVGAGEEDVLADSLMLLTGRRDLSSALGDRARQWVERECNWYRVADLYASFLEAVAAGRQWTPPAAPIAVASEQPPVEVEPDYIRTWGIDENEQQYIDTHITRLAKTLEMVPPGREEESALEMGAYLQITPALKTKLGYGTVRGCYYGQAGHTDHKLKVSTEGEEFRADVDLFDAEKDRFPYSDGSFNTVLCCELIEHLPSDPMHMMSEINRILKPNGHLVLTTPNIGSIRAISAILQGYHPGFFPAYLRPSPDGEVNDARHNREYTPKEVYRLLLDSGFTVTKLETGPFLDEPHPEYIWIEDLLRRYNLPADLRGDGIYIVGQKTGAVRDRYPAWLYS